MAKETRNVKQYKIFELTQVVIGEKRGNEQPPLESYVPIAIFDDQELLNAYLTARYEHEPAFKSSIREEWREIEPTANGFSLPFNPTFEAPVEPQKEEETDADDTADGE